ncbi:MAG: sulfur transferase domain-containing protein [Hyphomonadaceae bacterium]
MATYEERAARFDLATPDGRRRAEIDLLWKDHGFLRLAFHNFHWVSAEMARANQPSPAQIARYARQGFKTIVNLRGPSPTGYYALEREACAEHGVDLVDAPMGSREAPSKERIRRAKEIFETIRYPALMHCKSGADRAGIMAVLYKHFRQGVPIAQAMDQLSGKYLHVKAGKTGLLDFFFATYLEETRESGKSFIDWVEEDYEPDRVRDSFRAQWWGTLLTDQILRRE